MPAVGERADVTTWDVEAPQRRSRLPGVTMAGFGVHSLTAIRLVPHPAVMVAVDFGAGRPLVDHPTGRHRGSLLAGPGCGAGGTVVVGGADVNCVQVRLSPVIAQAVLGVSPAELRDSVVSLDGLWGRQLSRIREQLSQRASWQERFAMLDALLADRCAASSAVDAEVAWAWRRIVAGAGLVRVDDLAAEVGWSRKRLWSRFTAQLGLAPKRAGRLVRFDHAVHRLVAGQQPARVAAEAGYADQSHLHRDVRAFAGVTPADVTVEPFLAIDDVAWPARGPGVPAPRR